MRKSFAAEFALLGSLAAVAVILVLQYVGPSNKKHPSVLLSIRDSGARNKYYLQRRAGAASHSIGSRAKARFSLLDDDLKLADDLYSTAGYIPGNESLPESTPESLDFECGGAQASQTCFDASQACLSAAESVVSTLYSVDPVSATETRANSVCKCFVVHCILLLTFAVLN
jgi:hypothetical protein